MRRIEIDNEVYEALRSRASGFDQPNDVLRRELGLDGDQAVAVATHGRPGNLKPLIDVGLVAAGDRLVYLQPASHGTGPSPLTDASKRGARRSVSHPLRWAPLSAPRSAGGRTGRMSRRVAPSRIFATKASAAAVDPKRERPPARTGSRLAQALGVEAVVKQPYSDALITFMAVRDRGQPEPAPASLVKRSRWQRTR